MAEADPSADTAAPSKRSRRPLMIGVALAMVLGAAGFAVAWTGLLPGIAGRPQADGSVSAMPDIGFVPVDPVVVSLGPGARNRHLRMAAQLEVAAPHVAEVAKLTPRILDVLNGYLRAVEVGELEDPAAMVRIRAQLLRRIQMVTGEGRVRDLLITEFVVN